MDKPWTKEPNVAVWHASGFACHIYRHPEMQHLCGYVHLPAGHPWFGADYDAIHAYDESLWVHGGLTYAHAGHDNDWVIGFDCAHAGDYVPGLERVRTTSPAERGETYRNFEWVKAETESLAAQCREAAKKGA
jgi:hypothetical protein